MSDLGEFPVVTEKAESYLNERQLLDYRAEREDCLEWLLTFGKKPNEVVGYAPGTVKPRCYRMDRFYRYVWDHEEGYTVNLSHDHADSWMDHLARRDVSATDKRNCMKSLLMLYKWLHHERGLAEWGPEFRFSTDTSTQPRSISRERSDELSVMQHSNMGRYRRTTTSHRPNAIAGSGTSLNDSRNRKRM